MFLESFPMFLENHVMFYAFCDVFSDLSRHVTVSTFHYEPVGLWANLIKLLLFADGINRSFANHFRRQKIKDRSSRSSEDVEPTRFWFGRTEVGRAEVWIRVESTDCYRRPI